MGSHKNNDNVRGSFKSREMLCLRQNAHFLWSFYHLNIGGIMYVSPKKCNIRPTFTESMPDIVGITQKYKAFQVDCTLLPEFLFHERADI